MEARKLGSVLCLVAAVLLTTVPADATEDFTGQGDVRMSLVAGATSAICLAPFAVSLRQSGSAFFLAETFGPGTGDDVASCAHEPAFHGSHLATNVVPPLHRCFIDTGGGGVSIAVEPYTLEVAANTYTFRRHDRQPCSSIRYYDDTITIVVSATHLDYERTYTVGFEFTLTARGTMVRLD